MIRLILLLIAIGSGAGAVWMTLARPEPTELAAPQFTSNDVVQPTTTERPVSMSEILVASRPINAGQNLQREDLKWETIPTDRLRPDYILESDNPDAPEQLVNLVSVNALEEGEPLRFSRVIEPRPANLSMQLAPGMRAVSILVSSDAMAGGFILPGDRVDILHALPNQEGEPKSKVVASNIKVIALDQNTSDMIEGSTYLGQTATLELPAERVSALASASQSSGRIILVLRSQDDQQILSSEQPEQAAPADPGRAVRIIRNGLSETVTVRP